MVKEIVCTNLGKFYEGDGVTTRALAGVNLTFEKGEFTSIVGPSGSGKSTLLSLIGTLDNPSEGSLTYDGQEVMKQRKNQIADFRFEEIGFVFQQFHLLPTLTAIENTLTPLFGRKVKYNKQERAKEVLAQVGLADKLNSLPSQLSGGEQQRVAIARALIHKPSWLLADEPTGNLDTDNGERIFQLLQHLHEEENCGIIFVTHDPRLAKRADRIITLEDGTVRTDEMVNVS